MVNLYFGLLKNIKVHLSDKKIFNTNGLNE